jgi:hypothetical protein
MFDDIAAIRFGLAFAMSRFDVECEPLGDNGPDLAIFRDGETACVEVRRLRPLPTDVYESDGIGEDTLSRYGKPSRDIKKVIDEITGKFRQLVGKRGIVALWSNNDRYEELEFQVAMRSISDEVTEQCRRLPDDILFCAFRAPWRAPASGHLVYCEEFRGLSEPFSLWAQELESFSGKPQLRPHQ